MCTRIELVIGVLVMTAICSCSGEEAAVAEPMKGDFSFNIPQCDFKDTGIETIIVNEKEDVYYGQPDTVLLKNNHILVACSKGHGAREKENPETFVKESKVVWVVKALDWVV